MNVLSAGGEGGKRLRNPHSKKAVEAENFHTLRPLPPSNLPPFPRGWRAEGAGGLHAKKMGVPRRRETVSRVFLRPADSLREPYEIFRERKRFETNDLRCLFARKKEGSEKKRERMEKSLQFNRLN